MLRAIGDNERRVISLGYDVLRIKWLCFVISAALAGLAGAAKAATIQNAALTDVTWIASGDIILMAFIGGVSTFSGPMIGALVVVAMQTYLAALGEWVVAAQGAAFVVIVLVFRQGIVGVLPFLMRRWSAGSHVDAAVRGQAGLKSEFSLK
jgi:branched-chain amino acid transport system permease protein